ncbi:MAG TPA: glycosyltransferase family 2 protein [Candidatus Saccharimonadales bacterium]|nr:glycosyltransferase family 2 protein [Candidatus Saccharimonadales bacterium]
MSKQKPMIALIISGYNEEKVIARTLESAITAGMRREDIYVVSDNSSDQTMAVARTLLPDVNVMEVERSGKGLALSKAAAAFGLTERYRWIHVADADGGFAPNYFRVLRRELRVKNAAATGYITSTKNSMIGQYRVMEYTVGMEVVRRFQSFGQVVSVIPGPSSCFRADVFKKLDFASGALAEDFCVTLQIHRQKLGPIQYIEDAVVFTQDPQTFRDFTRQIRRWNIGILQGIKMYKIGLRPQRIDAYLTYQVMQNLMMFFTYAIWLPYLAFSQHNFALFPLAFLTDFSLTLLLTTLTAKRAKRWDILESLPNIYGLRWVALWVFMSAFVKVMIFNQHRVGRSNGIWQPVARKAVS